MGLDIFGRKRARSARRQAEAAEALAEQYKKDAAERKAKEETKQKREANKKRYLKGNDADFTPSSAKQPGSKGTVTQGELNRTKSLARKKKEVMG